MASPSIARLRVICQREKLRRPDDLTRRHRAVTIYATALLVRTPITADQVTLASIGLGLLAALGLAAGTLGWGLLGVLALYLSFTLDQVDGEVARYRRRFGAAPSLRGVYLDELRHLLIYPVPVFALAFSVARPGETWPFVAGFVAALALALARIEERLPALVCAEKGPLILSEGRSPESKDPAPRRTVVTGAPGPSTRPLRGLAQDERRSLHRIVVRAIHASYGVLAHQVLILFWLLAAVVIDRGLGLDIAEAGLLLGLALSSSLSLVAAVASRARPGVFDALVRAAATERST